MSGFFINIDRNILYQRLVPKERDPAVLWLLRTLVFYEPTENCLVKTPGVSGESFVYQRNPDSKVTALAGQLLKTPGVFEIEIFLSDELHLTLNDRVRLRPVSDGINFLGYIVRPKYRLVRRRVVGACCERLSRAEEKLRQKGLRLGERPSYPRHWPVRQAQDKPTLAAVYGWLNSYLGHFRHASSHRLVERIWERFPWLAEYFDYDGQRVTYTFTLPRPAFRLDQQKAQFSSQLPGHIIVAQLGNWYEIWGGHPAYPLSEEQRRFHRSHLPNVKRQLWESGLPVAWVAETGRHITQINERVLACRWPARNEVTTISELANSLT